MSDTPAASMDSTSFTETRIHNPRTLWVVRLVWAALMLVVLVVFVQGLSDFIEYSAVSCMCDSLMIGDDGEHVQLYPVPAGPADGLIFDEDILVALDGVPLPLPATRYDALRITDNGQPGSPLVLTVRTGDEPEREITLNRFYTPRALPRDAYPILDFVVMSVFVAVALLIAFNRSDDWMVLYTALALLCFGLSTLSLYYSFDQYHHDVFTFVNAGLWMITATYPFIFPDGRPSRRWTLGVGLIYGVWQFIVRQPSLQLPSLIPNLIDLGIVTLMVLFMRENYVRRLTVLRRQQTKWVILGIAVVLFVRSISSFIVPAIDSLGYTALGDLLNNPLDIFNRLLVLVIPITFAFAALRYRLYDIDLVINRSLVYGAVTVSILAIFGIGFLVSYSLTQNLLGAQNAAVPLAVGAFISAFAFNRLRVSAQRFVDRRIFRLNFDLNQLAAAQKSPEIKNPGALTGKTIGGYQVLGVLGKGGMGEVYHGERNGQSVALKILPQDLAKQSEFLSRFEREANTMRALDHPNIVKLISSGEEDGVHYLALEQINGADLANYLKQNGKLNYTDARHLLKDLAAALDYAHAQGLVHRDIKPSNVMVRDDPPQAILMDFGIAKIKDAVTRYTGSGAIGTIDYMAPEQITAAKEVDKRADVYALGVLAYEMLTGEKPFKGGAAQVMFAHLQQPPPDARDVVTDLPKNAAQAVQRAMSKSPQDRFDSSGDFAAML